MKGTVKIRGNDYRTVRYRLSLFREECPGKDGWGIHTECVENTKDVVIFRAEIRNPEGVIVAMGHSEERRDSSSIKSVYENAETSAIGRALASFGYGGTEFDCASETENVAVQQRVNSRAKTEKINIEKTQEQWEEEILNDSAWLNQDIPFQKTKGITWKMAAKDESKIEGKSGAEYLGRLENWENASPEIRAKAKYALALFKDYRERRHKEAEKEKIGDVPLWDEKPETVGT